MENTDSGKVDGLAERLCVAPEPQRPQYNLEELLAQCDPAIPRESGDDVWTGGGPFGDELI
jgi:hypothetical protein